MLTGRGERCKIISCPRIQGTSLATPLLKGLPIKDVRSQGERELVQCRHFADKVRGVSDSDVRTI